MGTAVRLPLTGAQDPLAWPAVHLMEPTSQLLIFSTSALGLGFSAGDCPHVCGRGAYRAVFGLSWGPGRGRGLCPQRLALVWS